jgi:signal transduction histidine kinase
VKIAARLAEHGRAVRLTIADNGTGMSPEILTRAFEPYSRPEPIVAGQDWGWR